VAMQEDQERDRKSKRASNEEDVDREGSIIVAATGRVLSEYKRWGGCSTSNAELFAQRT